MKFLLAKVALSKKSFDKGAKPFQDFALLVELRNSIMHLKFDRIHRGGKTRRVQHPHVIEKLRSKNVLAEFADPKTEASWLVLISTAAAAKWACIATAGIVRDIVDSIPESDLRESADLFYYRFGSFAPPA